MQQVHPGVEQRPDLLGVEHGRIPGILFPCRRSEVRHLPDREVRLADQLADRLLQPAEPRRRHRRRGTQQHQPAFLRQRLQRPPVLERVGDRLLLVAVLARLEDLLGGREVGRGRGEVEDGIQPRMRQHLLERRVRGDRLAGDRLRLGGEACRALGNGIGTGDDRGATP